MNVAVIGLGKIGLPLAVQYASTGVVVRGCDVSVETVASINSGIVPFPGEAELPEKLTAVIESGRLVATTSYREAVSQSDVIVVVVPLVVDHRAVPDFSALDSATDQIARNIKPGTLVCYETTLPVGTTRTRFAPVLADIASLTVGEDLFVAFSPERVFSGRIFADLRRYPKLVGATDQASRDRAVRFYNEVLEFDARTDLTRSNGVWDLGSCEAAEMAKLAETTYRDVNIGLANQFARFADAHGIDVNRVIDAANSQPFSHIHSPGIAVGGHCIPVYPQFYLWNDPQATIVSTARLANEHMPLYGVDLLEQSVGSLSGLRVALLGAAYRGGVKETAFSGVFSLAAELTARGAQPVVHDPLYTAPELSSLGFTTYDLGTSVDAAIIQTDHAVYGDLTEEDFPGLKAILDGRGIADPAGFPSATFLVIGRGER